MMRVWGRSAFAAAIVGVITFATASIGQHFTEVRLETVAELPYRPTGIVVTGDGRVIVSMPFSNYTDPNTFVAALAIIGNGPPQPYPDARWNRKPSDHPGADPQTLFLNVQSHTMDESGIIWVLDRGRPLGGVLVPGGAKIVGIDSATDQVTNVTPFDDALARGNFLNDLRVDGERQIAYVTDTANGGVIVVDLKSGAARRALESGFVAFAEETPISQGVVIDGTRRNSVPRTADGIALSADRETLFLQSHPWVGRRLYSVPTAVLRDQDILPTEVREHVRSLGSAVFSDGIQTDAQDRLYFTDYEHEAIIRREVDGTLTVLAQDPRISWPDAIDFGPDGSLYFTVAKFHQLYGGPDGSDISAHPFQVFRLEAERQ